MAQSDSRVGAPLLPAGVMPGGPMMHSPAMPMPHPVMPHPAMPRPAMPMPSMPHGAPMVAMPGGPGGGARWAQVPGGMNAYRPPSYGYTLPRYWVSAPFFISNWNMYGLPRPTAGFGWSRYYDDAVLTDRYGRVYDWRGDMDWSRDPRWSSEDYSDSYGYRDEPRPRRNNGVIGAVIGGVVGGIAGNVIAGGGNRLAGTLIGGGVGALAGQAIDKSTSRGRASAVRDFDDDSHRGNDRMSDRREDRAHRGRGYSYDGTWTGSWDGGPQRTYNGRFDGNVRPHWEGGWAEGGDPHTMGGGYYPGGYYPGGWIEGPSVTTVVVTPGRPIITKSVRYITEYVSVPVHHAKYVRRTKYVKLCNCGS